MTWQWVTSANSYHWSRVTGRTGRVRAQKMSPSTKPEIDWKVVGRRIREIRGLDVSQAEFAHELGVSQGQLSRYEQGSSEIGAVVLLRLARKSGKTIEWLLTGRETL